MAKSPQQIAQKWQRNLAQSTESIRAGVQSVTVSPTEKAAAAADRYMAGVQRAVAENKFQMGLQRVTLEEWKRSMIDKGIARVASGAAAAEGKMQDFMAEFLPHLEAGQRQLESMPRGDLETNLNRALVMMRHNARFVRRR